MIEHRHLASFVEASSRVFKVGHGSRVLQFASFSFDASILEWAVALSTGACLCFAESPSSLVGDYLAQVIEHNRVSFMQVTPTALATIPQGRDLRSLQQISVGGEASSASLISAWRARVHLVNAYGPTEAAYVLLSLSSILTKLEQGRGDVSILRQKRVDARGSVCRYPGVWHHYTYLRHTLYATTARWSRRRSLCLWAADRQRVGSYNLILPAMRAQS